MFISLDVGGTSDERGKIYHVIGIIPVSTPNNDIVHHIVDGSHPQLKTFPLTENNIKWCGNFDNDQVSCAIFFFPSKSFGVQKNEMINMRKVRETTNSILKNDPSRRQS